MVETKWAMRALVVIFWAGIFIAAPAQQNQIDLMALTQETQKFAQETDAITMVWWLPLEFWEASFAQEPSMTAADIENFINTLKPYTMVAAVDGSMGAFGGVTYKSEEYIRANTRLIDVSGKVYAPHISKEIDADTENLLQMFKPILANMLGPMGENFHFMLFPGKTASGQPVIDARGKGVFTVKLGAREFKYRLPLDALMPIQICPGCKQECKGSWIYCPWCGTKLARQP